MQFGRSDLCCMSHHTRIMHGGASLALTLAYLSYSIGRTTLYETSFFVFSLPAPLSRPPSSLQRPPTLHLSLSTSLTHSLSPLLPPCPPWLSPSLALSSPFAPSLAPSNTISHSYFPLSYLSRAMPAVSYASCPSLTEPHSVPLQFVKFALLGYEQPSTEFDWLGLMLTVQVSRFSVQISDPEPREPHAMRPFSGGKCSETTDIGTMTESLT